MELIYGDFKWGCCMGILYVTFVWGFEWGFKLGILDWGF